MVDYTLSVLQGECESSTFGYEERHETHDSDLLPLDGSSPGEVPRVVFCAACLI